VADFYPLVWPLLRLMEPETAHGLAVRALKTGLAPRAPAVNDTILRSEVWGLPFANPLGLAAGFDKNAEVADAMLAEGFGLVEVGTVTPMPQAGNPRPRMFRLPADGAVINRLGFNNQGLEAVAKRLAERRRSGTRIDQAGMVGANVGPNRDSVDPAADCAAGVRALAPLADYLVINVSSPNTPGLRDLQGREALRMLLSSAMQARDESGAKPPLLVKIAPDLTEDDRRDIAEVVLEARIDGLIATNTTVARPDSLVSPHKAETGGLSGRPLMEPSTGVLADIYRLTGGWLPIIGVGGVASGRDAYAKIRAGASLVQLYTGLVYHGPGLVSRINRDLAELLRADGFASVGEAVGSGTG
jgi:dihydroorotate dehydrogenase